MITNLLLCCGARDANLLTSSTPSHVVGSDTRFVIVQYHFFKNAGTTVNALLERNFPGEVAYLHGERSDSALCGDDLVRFLHDNGRVRTVSSHHLRPPSPEAEGFVFFDVISVRSPLDRLRSMYDFYHRSPEGEDPLIPCGREKDIAGFLGFLLDRYPHLVNNPQVNYFANQGRYTRPPNELDLQHAVDVIQRAAIPIVTESFDMCATAAEYYLQPAFGALDFSYSAENVAPGRLSGLEERLKSLRKACGRSLYEDLLRANQLDLKLTELAQKEIERRFAQIPAANRRLENFQERCRSRAT